MRKPVALRQGDRVALVSPAGPVPAQRVDKGIALLTEWGLRPEVAPHALDRTGYLAGRDADRLADVNAAFRDPGVRAVICTRGGYGCQRIVDGIDAEAVRRDPKPVVGFSDITGLQLALWRYARLVTVHGPVGAWNADRTGPASAASLHAALFTADPAVVASDPAEPTAALTTTGEARGTLLGGNLALLAAAAGTPDFPDLGGAILLLEDVGEAPYRVDRMLTQLRRTGALGNLAGVAVGQFTDCEPDPNATTDSPDVVATLRERLSDLGVPVLGGLPIGHGRDQRTVAVGVPALLDAGAGTLTVESGVRLR